MEVRKLQDALDSGIAVSLKVFLLFSALCPAHKDCLSLSSALGARSRRAVGQGHRRHAAFFGSVGDVQPAAVAGDDLVADGETDAGAAVLGAALVELLLYVGELRLRDAVSVVAHGDMHALGVGGQGHVDPLPLAAVGHGIVEQIEKDLLEPLGVAGDQRDLGGRLAVVELNAGLLHQLAVGKERVLQLGRDVDQLDAEVEAAVLDARELQQLLDHAGQTLGFTGYDIDAAQGVALHGLVVGDGLGPACDGGQRRAQLVGDLGDEVGPGLVGLRDLFGHLVDLVGQAADLIVAAGFELTAVAALRDVRREARQTHQRVGHIAPEPEDHQNDIHADDHQHGDGRVQVMPRDQPDGQHQQRQTRHARDHQLHLQTFKHRTILQSVLTQSGNSEGAPPPVRPPGAGRRINSPTCSRSPRPWSGIRARWDRTRS